MGLPKRGAGRVKGERKIVEKRLGRSVGGMLHFRVCSFSLSSMPTALADAPGPAAALAAIAAVPPRPPAPPCGMTTACCGRRVSCDEGREGEKPLRRRPAPSTSSPFSIRPSLVMAVLDHHHPGLSDKVNTLYTLSEAWCTSESDRDFGALERAVADMSPEDFIL